MFFSYSSFILASLYLWCDLGINVHFTNAEQNKILPHLMHWLKISTLTSKTSKTLEVSKLVWKLKHCVLEINDILSHAGVISFETVLKEAWTGLSEIKVLPNEAMLQWTVWFWFLLNKQIYSDADIFFFLFFLQIH